jgi:adenylate cyclase
MPDTLPEVARRLGVPAAELREWVALGIVPLRDGAWTPGAVAHARLIARLLERGHPLERLRDAARSGRLAFGAMDALFPPVTGGHSLEEAVADTGLPAELIRQVWFAAGFSAAALEQLSEDDLELLRRLAAVLRAGLPEPAFLQLVRVYGQALTQIADAEVRLFHLFVHEPLLRDGVAPLEVAEAMEGLAAELLPLASPVMDQMHQRALRHFIEQDVVGHLEDEAEVGDVPGRLRVTVAFADLAGYTRLTEEAGDELSAVMVEHFTDAVQDSLPAGARVLKSIGDAVMIVGSDPGGLAEWAVAFRDEVMGRPQPRIGMHHGAALYRDGDYFGRAVNLAARVGARAAAGEVLVTREVREAAGPRLRFVPVGAVELKGFDEATDLFLAERAAA